MFDIGWTELAVIACVAVLVVGPKELPGMLRTVGKTVGQLRKMAGDFQKQFDDAIREAELDEVKKTMQAPFQPLEDARKAALDFQGSVNKSINEVGKEASAGLPSGSVTGETPPVPAAFTAPLPTPVMPEPAALPAASTDTSAKAKAKAPAKKREKASTSKPAAKAAAAKAAPAKSPAAKPPAAKTPAAKTPAAKTVAKSEKPATKTAPVAKTASVAVTRTKPAAKAVTKPAGKAVAAKRAKPVEAAAVPVSAKAPASAGKAKPGKKA